MTYFVRTFASRPVFRLIVSHCGSRRVACTSRFSSQRSSQRLEWNLTLEVRVSLSPRAAIGPPRRRCGPSRTLERSGRTQHGNGSEAPLARIVTECACGHGSNRVIELAYNLNQANTGDWRGGGRDADPLSCYRKASSGPHGRHGRARSHKKPEGRHNSRRIILDSGRQKTQQSLF
jgi:hypothetical protein